MTDHNRERILVVEDDPDIRALIATRLHRLGWETHTVATGEAALSAVEEEAFSLIVLDIVLPGIDGWEVLRRLGMGPQHPPVLVVSVLDPPSGKDLREIGGYLVKPFSSGDIERAVGGLLGTDVAPDTTDDVPR